MSLLIRQALPQDVGVVADILQEAARWLADRGMAMWQMELSPSRVADEVNLGLFFLAECDGEAAGTTRFQLEDKLFWPDIKQDDSAFIHRLAIKRRFAGGDLSSALMLWAMPARICLGGAISAWIVKPRVCACGRFTSASDFSFTVSGKLALTLWRVYEYDIGDCLLGKRHL